MSKLDYDIICREDNCGTMVKYFTDKSGGFPRNYCEFFEDFINYSLIKAGGR